MFDEDLEAHHAVFGVATRPEQHGVAYPMTFVLDERGRVERKIVEDNYRVRWGGRSLAAEILGSPLAPPAGAAAATSNGPAVSARVWLDAASYFPFQRLGLHVELAIAPGWHVFGPEVPAGYAALAIDLSSAPEGARRGAITWPKTEPFRVQGIDEDFAVYRATIDVTVPVELRVPRKSGVVRLAVTIHLQSCSETQCLPPSATTLTLEVPEAPAL